MSECCCIIYTWIIGCCFPCTVKCKITLGLTGSFFENFPILLKIKVIYWHLVSWRPFNIHGTFALLRMFFIVKMKMKNAFHNNNKKKFFKELFTVYYPKRLFCGITVKPPFVFKSVWSPKRELKKEIESRWEKNRVTERLNLVWMRPAPGPFHSSLDPNQAFVWDSVK